MLAVSVSVDSPRLCAIAGSAVTTIVPSSASMKKAAATIRGMRRENATVDGLAKEGFAFAVAVISAHAARRSCSAWRVERNPGSPC